MIKSLVIPSVVIDEDKKPVGFDSIIVVGKKVVNISGENIDNLNYNSLLVKAMNEGMANVKVASELTFMLMPKDWRRICNYKIFERSCDLTCCADYVDLSSFHEVHGKKLPKDFKLPSPREINEAPERTAEIFESAFDAPPEEDGVFYIDDDDEIIDYAPNDDSIDDSVMCAVIDIDNKEEKDYMKKPAEVTNTTTENKEETTMKTVATKTVSTDLKVFFMDKGIKKDTKVKSVEEAEALLVRAKNKNIPAYYENNGKYWSNGVSFKKPAAQPVKVEVKDNTASIPTVDLWVDGACSNNGKTNAKAGWGCVLVLGEHRKEMSGLVEGKQTNNRAELAAVINGLAALKKHCIVLVHTDSQVVTRAPAMIAHGFKTTENKPAANSDMLEQLAELLKKHDVTIVKVEGHSGVELNEKCDTLARAAIVAAK